MDIEAAITALICYKIIQKKHIVTVGIMLLGLIAIQLEFRTFHFPTEFFW